MAFGSAPWLGELVISGLPQSSFGGMSEGIATEVTVSTGVHSPVPPVIMLQNVTDFSQSAASFWVTTATQDKFTIKVLPCASQSIPVGGELRVFWVSWGLGGQA